MGALARPRAATRAQLSTTTDRINLSAPWIDERDEELVLEVLRSGWLSLGRPGRGSSRCSRTRSARRTAPRSRRGRRASISACGSRASAPGDEVITSPYSFVASANCAIYEGATPVFADIDPHTLNLDPAAVEAAITPRTKALVAVDIFGYPAEYDELIAALRAARPRARRGFVRGARRDVQGQAARLARPSGGLGVLPEQADDDRRGRRRDDRTTRSSTSCSCRCATRAASRRRAGCSTVGSVTTTASTTSRRRSASGSSRSSTGSSRRDARSRRATPSCSRDVDVEMPLADDADHVRSWFVYVVKLPPGVDRDG